MVNGDLSCKSQNVWRNSEVSSSPLAVHILKHWSVTLLNICTHISVHFIFLFYFFLFDRNFCVRRDFISNPRTLKKRLMVVGLAMLLLSPFIVIFMLVYLFLRHAEQFYNHPSTASSRRWSNLSKWIFREFNEVTIISLYIELFPRHKNTISQLLLVSQNFAYSVKVEIFMVIFMFL